MKKGSVFLIIIYSILFISSVLLIIFSNKLYKDNKEMIIKFKEKEVYDRKGNINITKLNNEIDNSLERIKELLNKDVDSNDDLKVLIKDFKAENAKYSDEINDLNKQVGELEDKNDSLKKEYDVLNNQYQKILRERRERAEAEARKNMILIDNVPTINQYPSYPTGCESVALTILLRYYGVSVSPDNIIASLSKGDLPYYEDGNMFGGNPELEFIGNPYDGGSYGVYNNPIANVANIYKSGVNVRTWMPFSEVLDLVKNNHPVLVWTSMHLAVPYISTSWIYKPTWETISWKANEHAVVVVGYNDNYVVISDPLTGSIRYQSRSVFESRYNYYGQRAVYY